jgi:acetyl-CoA carboxylase beta subunit
MHEVQAAITREAPTGRHLAGPAGPEEPSVRGKSSVGVAGDILHELWVVCPRCQGMLYTREWADNLKVCSRCRYHFRITPHERLAQLLDDGSFVEVDADLRAGDPLSFVVGGQSYPVKLKEAALKSGTQEALIYGTGSIEGRSLVIAVHNFHFIGGSMGVAVGEKVSRAFDLAAA